LGTQNYILAGFLGTQNRIFDGFLGTQNRIFTGFLGTLFVISKICITFAAEFQKYKKW